MRENMGLYRGKQAGTDGWVYGWYCKAPYGRWPLRDTIIPSVEAEDGHLTHIEVDPNTVGQYTGLTDKNGAKIFEGDIVNIGEHNPTVNGLYCVFYSTVNHCWALKRSPEYHHHHFTFSDLNGFAEDSEVVGNIHDNPELLEGIER